MLFVRVRMTESVDPNPVFVVLGSLQVEGRVEPGHNAIALQEDVMHMKH